jgi:hypothetical protein
MKMNFLILTSCLAILCAGCGHDKSDHKPHISKVHKHSKHKKHKHKPAIVIPDIEVKILELPKPVLEPEVPIPDSEPPTENKSFRPLDLFGKIPPIVN